MATQQRKGTVAKFPLRLMPSVRRTAEIVSRKEGVSLNQFINLAVAEKLAHFEHEQWVRIRKEPTPERIAEALSLLDRSRGNPIEPGDEIPAGYRPRR